MAGLPLSDLPMHIMHVIDGLPLGGAERMLVDVANASVAAGHQVSVCVTRSCVDLASDLLPAIRTHVLGRRRKFDLEALRRFARLVRDEKVRLLHAHSRSTFSFLALVRALRLIRVPILFHDHYGSIEHDESVPLWFSVAGRLFLDQYVGVYDKLGLWARKAGVPATKIAVIGNALDLSRLDKATSADLCKLFDIDPGLPVGVVVAGVRRDKGIDVLLNALALHPLQRPIKILVIGGASNPDYYDHCRRLSSTLGLENTVSFVGQRSDVPSIIKGADFALLPSRSESGPLVLIEYILARLPIVSSLVGDIARIAHHEGLEDFVAPDDPAAFRRALDHLLALPAEALRARGNAGRSIATSHFNIENVMPRWEKLYAGVLARKAE